MTEKGWPATRYTGPPMTLDKMRANGVRRPEVSRWQRHHSAVIEIALQQDATNLSLKRQPRGGWLS
jgi:hypothetical protein